MKKFLATKGTSALGVLLIGSILIFALMRLIPGDPAEVIAGTDASPEAVDAIREELGLTGNVAAQYFTWIASIFTLNLGRSLVIGGTVNDLVSAAAGNTIVLGISALLLAVILSLIFSFGTALIDRHWSRTLSDAFSTFSIAVPNFATGTVLLVLFGVIIPILPAGGTPREGLLDRPDITLQFLLMPMLVLALPISAALARFLNDSIHREFNASYVTTARALGISRRRILLTQILPNTLPPAITVLGLQVGQVLGGAVIVETLFAWPGLGYLVQQAITGRDYPVIQILLLISITVFVIVQLITDFLHTRIDPRIRLGATS